MIQARSCLRSGKTRQLDSLRTYCEMVSESLVERVHSSTGSTENIVRVLSETGFRLKMSPFHPHQESITRNSRGVVSPYPFNTPGSANSIENERTSPSTPGVALRRINDGDGDVQQK